MASKNTNTTSNLAQGLQSYRKHDYLSALKNFDTSNQNYSYSSNRSNEGDMQQMTRLVLMGITHIQLCNYDQAVRILEAVREDIGKLDYQQSGQKWGEVVVVKVKVLVNLMVVQLLSCGPRMHQILQELISMLKQIVYRDRSFGIALFQLCMKSLLGFSSFAKLEDFYSNISAVLQKNRSRNRGWDSRQQKLQPVLLSALAMYCHLCGQTKNAKILEESAYQIAKGKDHVAALMALKHLEELGRERGEEGNRWRGEIVALMRGQLEGVGEETVFRNYSQKIQLGKAVVRKLVQTEQELHQDINPTNLDEMREKELDKLAVQWKLRTILQKQDSNNKQIATILELLQTNQDVLSLMGSSPFIKQSKIQYTNNIAVISEVMTRVIKRQHFSSFVERVGRQSIKNSVVINVSPPIQSQGRRHNLPYLNPTYTTEFYLPQHQHREQIEHQNIKQEQHSRQEQGHEKSRRKGGISITNNYKNNIYLQPSSSRSRSKPRGKESSIAEKGRGGIKNSVGVYKIAKERGKEGHRKVEPSKISHKQMKEANTSNSNRYREEPEPYLLEHYDGQEGVIDHFIKKKEEEPIQHRQPQNKHVDRRDRDRQEYIIEIKQTGHPHEQQHSQTHNINTNTRRQELHQNSSKKDVKLSLPHRQKVSTLRHVSMTTHSVLHQPPKDIQHQHHHHLQYQSQVINQTSFNFSSNPKKVKAQNIYHVKLTSQQTNQRLRRMIGLCQTGQYIHKRHFSSDGGALRFLQLSKERDRLLWGQTQKDIDLSSTTCAYRLEDIRGIVFGKITDTMQKQCNMRMEPWKCFSLVLKKRTFDLYCKEQRDLLFWVPGLSLCLRELEYPHWRENKWMVQVKKREEEAHNKVVFYKREMPRYYSLGRVLWRRFLMRLKWEHIKTRKGDRRRRFGNDNAWAVVCAAVHKMGYKLQHVKKPVG